MIMTPQMTPREIIIAGFRGKDVPLAAKYLTVMAATLHKGGQPGFKKTYATVRPEVRTYINALAAQMELTRPFMSYMFCCTYSFWFMEVKSDGARRSQT